MLYVLLRWWARKFVEICTHASEICLTACGNRSCATCFEPVPAATCTGSRSLLVPFSSSISQLPCVSAATHRVWNWSQILERYQNEHTAHRRICFMRHCRHGILQRPCVEQMHVPQSIALESWLSFKVVYIALHLMPSSGCWVQAPVDPRIGADIDVNVEINVGADDDSDAGVGECQRSTARSHENRYWSMPCKCRCCRWVVATNYPIFLVSIHFCLLVILCWNSFFNASAGVEVLFLSFDFCLPKHCSVANHCCERAVAWFEVQL